LSVGFSFASVQELMMINVQYFCIKIKPISIAFKRLSCDCDWFYWAI